MPLLALIGQSVAMFAASAAVGMLPLVFSGRMSALSLESIQVFGMGLLVGAALTIIIPEGVETLYAADPDSRAVGVSLLSGFALMLLVDLHPENRTPSPPPEHRPLPLFRLTRSVENLSPHPPHTPEEDPDETRHPMLPKAEDDCETHAAAHGLSATLGLVIHGVADGIAIGASSLMGNAKLGMVVFIAVIVHKGPAALGLTTTLLSLHLSPAQVRRRLFIFSSAAPVGAIVTYALVKFCGDSVSGTGRGSLGWWTGVVLLFSGGSFLYVATVIQPITQTGPDDHCHDVHHEVHRNDKPHMNHHVRTALILGGMLLPLGLSALVGQHEH